MKQPGVQTLQRLRSRTSRRILYGGPSADRAGKYHHFAAAERLDVSRGMTLIELLIAMALVLAIAAISTPIVLGMLEERRFEAVGAQVEQQLQRARAHAQLSGRPVEARYLPDNRRLVVRQFDPDHGADELESDQTRFIRGSGSNTRAQANSRDDEREITDSWAVRVLPRGMRLTDQPPTEFMMESASTDVWGVIDEGWNDGTMRNGSSRDDVPIRLAVFLPDGTVMLARDVWLRDDDDRVGRISVSAFTGSARYERQVSRRPADSATVNGTPRGGTNDRSPR